MCVIHDLNFCLQFTCYLEGSCWENMEIHSVEIFVFDSDNIYHRLLALNYDLLMSKMCRLSYVLHYQKLGNYGHSRQSTVKNLYILTQKWSRESTGTFIFLYARRVLFILYSWSSVCPSVGSFLCAQLFLQFPLELFETRHNESPGCLVALLTLRIWIAVCIL